MKKIVLFLVVLCTSTKLFAQSNWEYNWDIKAHDIGQLHLNLGFGAPRTDKKLFDTYNDLKSYDMFGTGPFCAKVEYGFNRIFSIQLGVNYTNYNASWNEDYFNPNIGVNTTLEHRIKVNNYAFIARLNHHLYVTPFNDLYIGGGIGYDMYTTKDETDFNANPGFVSYFKIPSPYTFETSIGYKHFFMTRTAFFVEAGYGKSYIQAGVSIKLIQPKSNRIF